MAPTLTTMTTVVLVVFDFETTGVPAETNTPVQFGARACRYSLDKREWLDDIKESSFCTDVYTEQAVSDEAFKVHGIDAKRISAAPRFDKVWEQFGAFVQGVKRSPDERVVFGGHNVIKYDLIMLAHCLVAHKMDWRAEFAKLKVVSILDTWQWAIMTGPRNQTRLGQVFKRVIGHDMENAHDALADCVAVELIVRKAALNPLDAGVGIENVGKSWPTYEERKTVAAAAVVAAAPAAAPAAAATGSVMGLGDQPAPASRARCVACGYAYVIAMGHVCLLDESLDTDFLDTNDEGEKRGEKRVKTS